MSAGDRDPWYAYTDRTPKTYTQEDLDTAVAAERERVRYAIEEFQHWLGPQAKKELLLALYGHNTELKDDAKKSGAA
jgi:hypothetical protein